MICRDRNAVSRALIWWQARDGQQMKDLVRFQHGSYFLGYGHQEGVLEGGLCAVVANITLACSKRKDREITCVFLVLL